MSMSSEQERWKARRETQRRQMAAQERKRLLRKVLVISGAALIAAIMVFFIYRSVAGPGKYDSFAQCMTEKGMVMYGTDWCPHCQRQKQLFGKSFQYINFVDCDTSKECEDVGIESFPTWVKDGKLYEPGLKPLVELAKLSGCELP